jgi:hypothetical protein
MSLRWLLVTVDLVTYILSEAVVIMFRSFKFVILNSS